MILSSYPTLDLHGYDRDYAIYKVKEFISDSLKQKKYTIVIIHGIGEGILKNSVTDYLKKCKNVEKYETDIINVGCTVVNLKKNN